MRLPGRRRAEDPATGWEVNQAAVGRTFTIHAPNPHHFADCGEQSALFKGLADTEVKESDAAGTIDADVTGVQGCRAGQVVDCVVFLPLVVPKTDRDHPEQLLAVQYGVFSISQPRSNTHLGTFLGGYIVTGEARPPGHATTRDRWSSA